MSKHFVLDFDGTLINTDVYWEWIVSQFLGIGQNEQMIREAGERLFPVGYTVVQHAQGLGLHEALVQELTQRAREHVSEHHASLIFSDVPSFFSRFVDAEKSILTFGDREHQIERIRASGIHSSISKIRTASNELPKAMQLKDLAQESSLPVVFIDDDLDQLMGAHQARLPIELIRMRRDGQRKSKDDHKLDNEAWRVIRSFDELG